MICRHQPPWTEQDYEVAREVRANGGSLTLDEIVHTRAYERVAMAWTRARANRWIAREREQGRWLDAHAHKDGSIYVPRV